MSKSERLAMLHQMSAAVEHGSVRYGLSRHPAIGIAIKDHTIGHQLSAQSYYAYAREQLGISDEDQVFA
jgi:hypothetical protein